MSIKKNPTADLITLGREIQKARLSARKTHLDLAFEADLGGTAAVYRVEKGKLQPRPDTLEKIAKALEIDPVDIEYWYGLAGYKQETKIPNLDLIQNVLNEVGKRMEASLFPSYVVDFKFNCWMANSAAAAYTNGSLIELVNLASQGVNLFDLGFDSRLPPMKYSNNLEEVQRDHIIRFKLYNLYRRHEAFYKNYPQYMQLRLLPEDYLTFQTMWTNTFLENKNSTFPLNMNISFHVGEHTLYFMVTEQPLLFLNHLFCLMSYHPVDAESNIELCKALFNEFTPKSKKCVKVWELTDINALF